MTANLKSVLTEFGRFMESVPPCKAEVDKAESFLNDRLDELIRKGAIADSRLYVDFNPAYDPIAAECESYQEYRLKSAVLTNGTAVKSKREFEESKLSAEARPYLISATILIKPASALSFIKWELERK